MSDIIPESSLPFEKPIELQISEALNFLGNLAMYKVKDENSDPLLSREVQAVRDFVLIRMRLLLGSHKVS